MSHVPTALGTSQVSTSDLSGGQTGWWPGWPEDNSQRPPGALWTGGQEQSHSAKDRQALAGAGKALPLRTSPFLQRERGLEFHSCLRWKPLSPGSCTQLRRVPLTCTWGPGHQAQCPVPLPLGKRQPVCRPWAGGERRRGSLGGVSRDPSGRGKPLAEGRPARDPAPGGAVGEAVLSNHSISVLPTACGPARPGGVSGAPF